MPSQDDQMIQRVPGECRLEWADRGRCEREGQLAPQRGQCLPEVDGMEVQMTLHLPRDAVSVPVGRQVLDSCLETLGVAPDTRADIALALSEACANVVQHAGPGEEYEVQVSARDRRCTIEVVNAGSSNGNGEPAPGGFAVADEPAAMIAEHGRGLKIMEAVVDNLKLTGNGRQGTTVHFEKTLVWVPGAAGQHLFRADVEAGDPTVPIA
jgi:serine/threonine-protein kinase RsbW